PGSTSSAYHALDGQVQPVVAHQVVTVETTPAVVRPLAPNQGSVLPDKSSYHSPDAPRQAGSGAALPSAAGLLIILHDSPDPVQRQWGAEMLGAVDWTGNAEAVPVLLAGARTDPATGVRVACIRTLVKKNVNSALLVAAFKTLQTDPDARVQQEATEALIQLNANPPAAAGPASPYGGAR